MVLDKFLICAFLPDVVRAAAGAVECILKKLFFNWSKLFFSAACSTRCCISHGARLTKLRAVL